MQQAKVGNLLHNGIDTAGSVQVFHIGRAGRRQVADVRNLFRNPVGDVHIQFNSAFVRDSRQVQHRVGRAAERHIHRQRVLKRLVGHDIPRTDILFDHLHDLHTGMFGQLNPLRVNSRDGAVSAQAHAQHLSQAVHRVCSVHTRAGTAGRAGIFLPFMQLLLVDLTGIIGALCLKHRRKRGLVSIHMTGKHRAAGNKYRRDIQPGCRHQQAGNVFVTVGNHDQTVKLMCQCHSLGRIGDQVAGYQRVFHSDMPHRDTVADSDCRDNNGSTASHCDTHFDRLCDLIQIHMPGDNLVPAGDDADQRTLHLLTSIAQRIEQRTGSRAVGALLYMITSHDIQILSIDDLFQSRSCGLFPV